MTEAAQNGDRRTRTQTVIEELLSERQEMLVRYCEVAGLQPYTDDKPVQAKLQEFCQIMVDYFALGHFEVFERITRGDERRQAVADIAKQLYPRIEEATSIAVAFNDKYASDEQCQVLDGLERDLSELGEILATRVELEDQLLFTLLARPAREKNVAAEA